MFVLLFCYPKGFFDKAVGSHVDNSGNSTTNPVTIRSDMKKIIAPLKTVWIGIFAIPLTA